MPDDIPAPTLGGIVGCERGQPSCGHPGLAAAGGGAGEIPGVERAYIKGMMAHRRAPPTSRWMVRCGAGIDVPESATPGDVAPALGSSGTPIVGVSGPHLSGSPGFPPMPIG
jgi:hypothetical protein